MKLIRQIYRDAKGREWILSKECLPKKRGYYNYWIADCPELNKAYRADLKGELKKQIEDTP